MDLAAEGLAYFGSKTTGTRTAGDDARVETVGTASLVERCFKGLVLLLPKN